MGEALERVQNVYCTKWISRNVLDDKWCSQNRKWIFRSNRGVVIHTARALLHLMNDHTFQAPVGNLERIVMRHAIGELFWNEVSEWKPKSFLKSLNLFNNNAVTNLKRWALVAYPIYIYIFCTSIMESDVGWLKTDTLLSGSFLKLKGNKKLRRWSVSIWLRSRWYNVSVELLLLSERIEWIAVVGFVAVSPAYQYWSNARKMHPITKMQDILQSIVSCGNNSFNVGFEKYGLCNMELLSSDSFQLLWHYKGKDIFCT